MKYLAAIFILLCFFPYLSFFGLGTDTQPNALLLSIALLFTLKNKIINLPLILLWVLLLFAILLVFTNEASSFLYIKNLLNYLSPPVVALASYNLLVKLNYKISFPLFLGICLIYLFVGLVQMYIYPEFMTFLINDQFRGILFGGRGVVSLCPEPAFYGSLCLFFIVFSLMNFNRKQNYILIPILIFQLFFLSRAATAMAILLVALAIFTIVQLLRFRWRYLAMVIILGLIVKPIINSKIHELEETRAGTVALQFIEEPLLITKVDESVGVRFTYAIAPFLSMKHNNFLPMGLGNFKPFLKNLYQQGKYRNFISTYLLEEKNRLTGSINMVLFQLGFIGLLLPLAIYLSFKNLLSTSSGIFAFVLFITILFTQIQLMHSMIGFIIAYALYIGHQKWDQGATRKIELGH